MIKTGLFFGSFNPVHIGHLMIANYFYSYTNLDEIRMVVTPNSPWKTKNDLIDEVHRFNMVQLVTRNCNWINVSLFEKELPAPNYTYFSLQHLRKTEPDKEFVLIIGGDNYTKFRDWRNVDDILSHHEVWAFPRHNQQADADVPGLKLFNAPQFEISAEFIRAGLRERKDMRYFLPEGVYSYIKEHNLL